MALMKCPECEEFINEDSAICPQCGYPIKKEAKKNKDLKAERNIAVDDIAEITDMHIEDRKSSCLSKIRTGCLILMLCFAIGAVYFFIKGYDVKNEYYNSEYSSFSKNAYVGGDAYNYIINGTYFTAYSIIGSSCMISSVLFGCCAVYVHMKKMEE